MDAEIRGNCLKNTKHLCAELLKDFGLDVNNLSDSEAKNLGELAYLYAYSRSLISDLEKINHE